MKNLTMLLLLAFLAANIPAQELDSLKAIMGKTDEEPGAAISEEGSTYTPVIVTDNGEEVNVTVMDKEVVKVIDNTDSTYVKIGGKGLLQVVDSPDSTTIRVGDKEIRIVERNGDTDIHLYDVEERHRIRNPRFRGHWAGFEWGLNNFLDADHTLSREGEDQFMDLNTGRSWAINLNFAQYSLGFGTSHFGAVTGLGLEFNNYYFDDNNTIAEIDDKVVGIDTISATKSKLTTTFVRFPLLLEVQFPNASRSKRAYISAGIVAGLKLGSHTKVVNNEGDGKDKDKVKDDFNISPFRYGLTARVGFGGLSLFCDYYFTPMFVEDKGPELNPITMGLALSF